MRRLPFFTVRRLAWTFTLGCLWSSCLPDESLTAPPPVGAGHGGAAMGGALARAGMSGDTPVGGLRDQSGAGGAEAASGAAGSSSLMEAGAGGIPAARGEPAEAGSGGEPGVLDFEPHAAGAPPVSERACGLGDLLAGTTIDAYCGTGTSASRCADTVAAVDFCRAFFVAELDWAKACAFESTCAFTAAMELLAPCREVALEVASGKVQFEPHAGVECLAALPDVPCSDLRLKFDPLLEPCVRALAGTSTEGEPCKVPITIVSMASECAPGLYCALDAEQCPGRCAREKATGEGCASDEECGPFSTCIEGYGCVPRARAGQPCRVYTYTGASSPGASGDCAAEGLPTPTCSPGLVCDTGAPCEVGECRAPRPIEACAFDQDCPAGFCRLGECQPLLPSGAECTDSFQCATHICGSGGRCESIAAPGEPCGPEISCFGICRSRVCERYSRAGEPCAEFGDCFSGNCQDGLCTGTCMPSDPPCGAAGQGCCGQSCEPGARCLQGRCEICGRPGEPCCPRFGCEAELCCDIDGTCVTPGTACGGTAGACQSSGSCSGCGAVNEPCCALADPPVSWCSAPGLSCVGPICQGPKPP